MSIRFLVWSVIIGLVIVLGFKYPQYSLEQDAHDIQTTYEYKKYVDLMNNSPYNEDYMLTGMCYTTIKVAARMNYGFGSGLKDISSLRTTPILTLLAKIHWKFDNLGEKSPDYMFNSDLTYGLFKSDIAEKAAYAKWVLKPTEFSNQYRECVSIFQ